MSAELERVALVQRIKSGAGKSLLSELTKGLTDAEVARLLALLQDAENRGELIVNRSPQDPHDDPLIITVGPA